MIWQIFHERDNGISAISENLSVFLLAMFILHMRRNCYLRFRRSFHIRFSDPCFQKESNNLAMFQVLFSLHRPKLCHISIFGLFDLMILNVCRMWFTKFEVGQLNLSVPHL